MRLAKLQARPRRPPVDSGTRPEHAIASNLLGRDFRAGAPNEKWAANFTYIDTGEGTTSQGQLQM